MEQSRKETLTNIGIGVVDRAFDSKSNLRSEWDSITWELEDELGELTQEEDDFLNDVVNNEYEKEISIITTRMKERKAYNHAFNLLMEEFGDVLMYDEDHHEFNQSQEFVDAIEEISQAEDYS